MNKTFFRSSIFIFSLSLLVGIGCLFLFYLIEEKKENSNLNIRLENISQELTHFIEKTVYKEIEKSKQFILASNIQNTLCHKRRNEKTIRDLFGQLFDLTSSEFFLGNYSIFWNISLMGDNGENIVNLNSSIFEVKKTGISFYKSIELFKNKGLKFIIHSHRKEIYLVFIEELKIKNCFDGFLGFVIDSERLRYELFKRERGLLIGHQNQLTGLMDEKIQNKIREELKNRGDHSSLSFNDDNKNYSVVIKRNGQYQDILIIGVIEK